MNTLIARTLVLLLLAVTALHAQEPRLINYQGRVAVGGVNFDGSGQFKFAIVDACRGGGIGKRGAAVSAAVDFTACG